MGIGGWGDAGVVALLVDQGLWARPAGEVIPGAVDKTRDRELQPDLLMSPFLLAAVHKIWLRFSLRALSIIFWDG